jgi:hypothetical protein
VLIAVLLFSEATVAKLPVHAISPEEVRQVNDGDRIVIANPRPRRAGSVLMIGPTHGGRILTCAQSRARRSGNVRTAWQASAAQIRRYRRDR